MAFQLKTTRGNIEVILWQDSAVKCSREEYDNYLKSFSKPDGPSEDLLKLGNREDATRFVMRRSLSFERKQALRSKNIRVRKDDVELDANYSVDLARAALLDIINPAGVDELKAVRFKKDKDGLASPELINSLDDMGVLTDLIAAHSAATLKGEAGEDDTKN